MCGSCGSLRALPKAKALDYAYQIPLVEFSEPGSRCKFKVWFCTSPAKVNAALAKIRVPEGVAPLKVNSMEEMEALAVYHDSGEDVAFYGVDLDQFLSDKKNLSFSQAERDKTECNLVCTY